MVGEVVVWGGGRWLERWWSGGGGGWRGGGLGGGRWLERWWSGGGGGWRGGGLGGGRWLEGMIFKMNVETGEDFPFWFRTTFHPRALCGLHDPTIHELV